MRLSAFADTARSIRLFPSSSLLQLVLRHRADCEEEGLDVDALDRHDDPSVQRWLQGCAGMLPAGLADDLERIHEVADDRGATALLDAVRRSGTDARRLGMDPLEVAVTALLDHRVLFDEVHAKRIVETLRGTTEFVGRQSGPGLTPGAAELQELEARLGRQFDARSRSAHCRVGVCQDGDRMIFTIAHGALYRADEALETALPSAFSPILAGERPMPVYLAERAVRYRPQRRDIVVYEANAGRLRLRAGEAATLHAYRQAFGELLFADPEWFGTEPIVSLQPLVLRGKAVEVPTPGIREIRLVGLIIRRTKGKVALDSEELWPFLHECLIGALERGQPLEATFRVYLVGSEDTPFRVKVRAPNYVFCDRRADALVRPWLEARGFLAQAGGWAGE